MITVNSQSGVRNRLMIRDCDDVAIKPADVIAVRYTVYGVYLGVYTAVEGHTNVLVAPEDVIFDETLTDEHTELEYNFEHRISMIDNLPFPRRDWVYLAEYRFFDEDGEAHVHQYWFRTDREATRT